LGETADQRNVGSVNSMGGMCLDRERKTRRVDWIKKKKTWVEEFGQQNV